MLDMDTQVYYDYRATLVVFTTVSCALFDVNATIASEMFDIFINTARENKMAKLNQRVAISKYLMKEALLKLLKEKSIGKISVSELCKEAEINRTTFYRYYETPRDILQEIALDCIKNCSIRQLFPRTPRTSGNLPLVCVCFCMSIPVSQSCLWKMTQR